MNRPTDREWTKRTITAVDGRNDGGTVASGDAFSTSRLNSAADLYSDSYIQVFSKGRNTRLNPGITRSNR